MKFKPLDYFAIIISIIVFVSLLAFKNVEAGDASFLMVQDETGQALYPLSEDRTIIAKGPVGNSVIVIEKGSAHFEDSDCSNKLCVLMGTISLGGEWAACLPNKVFISIEGEMDEKQADMLSY